MVNFIKAAAIALCGSAMFMGQTEAQFSGLDLSLTTLTSCINMTALSPLINEITTGPLAKVISNLGANVTAGSVTSLNLTATDLEELCTSLNPPDGKVAKALKGVDLYGATLGYAANATSCKLKDYIPLLPGLLGVADGRTLINNAIVLLDKFNVAFCEKKDTTRCGVVLKQATTGTNAKALAAELATVTNSSTPLTCSAVTVAKTELGCCYDGTADLMNYIGTFIGGILNKIPGITSSMKQTVSNLANMPSKCASSTCTLPNSLTEYLNAGGSSSTSTPTTNSTTSADSKSAAASFSASGTVALVSLAAVLRTLF